MRRVELTKKEAHVLGLNLEGKATGYSRKELRWLDRTMDAIEDATGEYHRRIERVAAQHRAMRRKTSDQVELARIAEEESRAVEAINEEDGGSRIVLTLEEAEYDFVKDQWGAMNSFRGGREVRRMVMAIDAAVEGAEKVKMPEAPG